MWNVQYPADISIYNECEHGVEIDPDIFYDVSFIGKQEIQLPKAKSRELEVEKPNIIHVEAVIEIPPRDSESKEEIKSTHTMITRRQTQKKCVEKPTEDIIHIMSSSGEEYELKSPLKIGKETSICPIGYTLLHKNKKKTERGNKAPKNHHQKEKCQILTAKVHLCGSGVLMMMTFNNIKLLIT